MLTAIVSSTPSPRHIRCWRRASLSTHLVSGPISCGALHFGQEAGGQQQTLPGVAPADECLDASGLAGRQVDLGLVVNDEFVAGDAITQVSQQGELIAPSALLCGVEDGVAVAGSLGLIHRQVGTAEQIGVVLPCSGNRAMPMLADT